MKTILSYLKPYAGRMSLGLIIKFTGTIMDLLLPYILAHIIDNVVPLQNQSLIFFWGGIMLVCSVIAVITNIAANRMAARVASNTTQAIRHDLFSKIMNLSCRQIDQVSIPSLESRLTSDTYHVHQLISSMQRLGVRAPILLLGGILVALTLEPVLTLVLVATLPFLGILVWQVTKRGVPLFTWLQQGIDNMVRVVRENISGARVIKALSKTEYEKKRFDRTNQEVVAREKKANIIMALTNPAMNLFLNLGLVGVIVVGAFRVDAGLTQPGKIIAFLSYFTIILTAMMAVTRMFVIYSKGSASAGRISEILHLPHDLDVLSGEQPLTKPEAHIVFENVSFSYNKRHDNVADISFMLRRGGMLGVIGATGSGKSTLANLLMRLYDVDRGSIFIGGTPLEEISEQTLHEMFGVVFQNDVLFADTIRENIDFGRGLSDEQIERAAKDAQAMEFISALPDRFDHMLTAKGANLSGGQKQRLLIARALAASPEILILDDASSALDYRTDALLRLAIKRHYANTTSVVVAQRISSIMHADIILVLDEGEVLGCGSHEELLVACPLYKEIFVSQMGGGFLAS